MRYSHAEPAQCELDAVYLALVSLQMMGRFMSYASDDLLAKQGKHPNKKLDTPKQQKPTITKPARISHEPVKAEVISSPEPVIDESTQTISDPATRERSIILKIVSR